MGGGDGLIHRGPSARLGRDVALKLLPQTLTEAPDRRAGRTAQGDEALKRLEAEHAEDSAVQIAVLYATRGDADAAFGLSP